MTQGSAFAVGGTPVIVRLAHDENGRPLRSVHYRVIALHDLFKCEDVTRFCVWSATGWTRIISMSKQQHEESSDVQLLQSNENMIIGRSELMRVMCDPARITELKLAVPSLIDPLIRLIWDYAGSVWLLGSYPSEWYRCPMPPPSVPTVSDDEPLLLICDECRASYGCDLRDVVIESEHYYSEPAVNRNFCQKHHEYRRYNDRKHCWVKRQNPFVTLTDVINHPDPRRYLRVLRRVRRADPDHDLASNVVFWYDFEMQSEVVILEHAEMKHCIVGDPTSDYLKFVQYDASRKNPTIHSVATTDTLYYLECGKLFNHISGYGPQASYGIKTQNGSFCAGIGFWSFASS